MSDYDDVDEDLPGPRRDDNANTDISTGTIVAARPNEHDQPTWYLVSFSWDARWPFDVLFKGQAVCSPRSVKWLFDLDLLVNGGGGGPGGDLRITYRGDDLLLVLDSAEGHAELVIPAAAVRRFIARVLAAPTGKEPSFTTATDRQLADALTRLTMSSRPRAYRILARAFPRGAAALDRGTRAASRLQRTARRIIKEFS